MSEFVFDPEHPETRERIDRQKDELIQEPHVRAWVNGAIAFPQEAFRAWVRRVASAELLERAYREGVQRRLEQHDEESGVYDDE